jgi:hypothetical protein
MILKKKKSAIKWKIGRGCQMNSDYLYDQKKFTLLT